MEVALLIENLKRENESYLAAFQSYLETYGVSQQLIDTYIYNTEYYLNEYLAEECQKHMPSGVREMDPFFMDYFINDMAYTTLGRMERIIKGLRMFYRSMHDLGFVNDEIYAFFEIIVKENKQKWIDNFEEWQRIDEDIAQSVIEDLEE